MDSDKNLRCQNGISSFYMEKAIQCVANLNIEEPQQGQTPVTHKFYELYSGFEIVPQLVEQFTKVKRGAAKAPRAFTEGYDPTVEAKNVQGHKLLP